MNDFDTRASNLLFDLTHKIDDKELEKYSEILKRLSEEIKIRLKKMVK